MLIRNEIKGFRKGLPTAAGYSTKEASGHQGFLRVSVPMTLRQGMIEPASDEASRLTSDFQDVRETEEHSKLNHGEIISKIRLSEIL